MTARVSATYQASSCGTSVVAACTSARICALKDTALLAVSLFALLRIIWCV